jgi:serine protease inhibitor
VPKLRGGLLVLIGIFSLNAAAFAQHAPERIVARACNNFGFSLFQKLGQADPNTNRVISPYSVAAALAMTANGAVGETQTAMLETLELSGLSFEQINQLNASIADMLSTRDTAIECRTANSIWYSQGAEVRNGFLDTIRTYYHADIAGLNLQDSTAINTINAWVNRATDGNIPEIIETIDPGIVMLLINALFFKGLWAEPFDPALTREAEFTTTHGARKLCRMMTRSGEFQYFENGELQAVDLPYGDGEFAFTVILPRPGIDADAIIAQLDSDFWEDISSQLAGEQGRLTLPKFTLTYQQELNDILTALGMGIAFDQHRADFSGVFPQGGVWIDEVKHKTFIEVEETGTKAATAVQMRKGEMTGFVMRVDRPFLFAIHDRKTASIIILGEVVDPLPE